MAKKLVYGPMDTRVRFWVDGKSFWSTVPGLAVEMALRDWNAEDFTARNYLARIATNSRHNPRGKGVKIDAKELDIEIPPPKRVLVQSHEGTEGTSKVDPNPEQNSLF